MVLRIGSFGTALATVVMLAPLNVAAPVPGNTAAPTSAPILDTEDVAVIVIEEHQARAWELQIELDLMADSVTFPHGLRCRAGSAGMEVRGYVPNPLVRDRALAIAKKACPMAPVDNMVIQPNIVYGTPGKVSLEDVQRRLASVNSRGGNAVAVQAGPNGQLILNGRVGSFEERVKYSRSLRGLPGCTSVKNELALPAGSLEGVRTASSAPPARIVEVKAAETRPIETKRAEAKAVVPKPPDVPADNPLLPQSTRPTPSVRGKTATAAAQMPPAPVAPNRRADYRPAPPSAPVAAPSKEEKTHAVVQASQGAPALPHPSQPPPGGTRATTPSGLSSPSQPPPAGTRATTPPALSTRVQQSLKQRVRGTLGAAVKGIEMKFDGSGGVRILVQTTGQHPDFERIARTIVQSPELQNFEVILEFRADQ